MDLVQIAQHQKIIPGAVGRDDVGLQIKADRIGRVVADGIVESPKKPFRVENLLEIAGRSIRGRRESAADYWCWRNHKRWAK